MFDPLIYKNHSADVTYKTEGVFVGTTYLKNRKKPVSFEGGNFKEINAAFHDIIDTHLQQLEDQKKRRRERRKKDREN